MTTNNSNHIKSYKTKNGETNYQFRIILGADPYTNRLKTTTRRGYKTITEAETAYNRLTEQAAIPVNLYF